MLEPMAVTQPAMVRSKDHLRRYKQQFLHQVLRKDRAVFYADHMDDGVHRIEYLARVRAAGQSVAPAAKAEAMYDPDTIGLSASQLIVTLPMDE